MRRASSAQLPPPEMWGRFLAIIRPHLINPPRLHEIGGAGLGDLRDERAQAPSKADEATRRAIQEWYEKNDAPFTRASIEQFQREAAHGRSSR